MRRAVFFDLDGTLVDTWRLYVEAYRKGLEEYFGRPVSLEEIISFRPNSELRMFRRVVGEDNLDRCLGVFYRHYESRHADLFDGAYEGVHGLLSRLREKSVVLGIITGKSRRAYDITMEKSGLGPFDVDITDDDVANLKPDPEGILAALTKTGIGPEECIYIGDATGDQRAAHGAGMAFGAALWSKSDAELGRFVEKIRELPGESVLFDTPASVIDYLAR